jgi:hypothetical protein
VPLIVAPAPVGDPLVLPVAGQLHQLTYRPMANGQPLSGAVMTDVQLYTSAARTGTPALTVPGPAAESPEGVHTFPAALMPAAGLYYSTVTWTINGSTVVDSNDTLVVHALGGDLSPAPVTATEVRARLNHTLTVDDAEIERMIEAALAEYDEFIGPVASPVVENINGGAGPLILRSDRPAQLLSAAYSDGAPIDLSGLQLERSGTVHVTGTYLTPGRRNITVTYSLRPMPPHHREAIVADVAGYFAATQRGGASFAPRFAGEGYSEVYDTPTGPLVLFPRIRRLAPPRVGG